MRKSLMTIIICFLSWAAFLMTISPPVFSRVFALVEGTVTSVDGKPIPNARVVFIFNEDGGKIELTADKKGKWRKANLRPGEYTIGFIADGYEPQNFNIQLSAIKKNPPLNVQLSPVTESPFLKADALYQEKKYEEALQEYKNVLEKNPDLYQAYEKIGICYLRMENQEMAIDYFIKMLECDPQSQDALINLSAIYFEQGRLEEGMKYFKQFDESRLTDPGTFYNLGILLFKNHQIEMAINYLQKCVALNPGFVDGHYQLGLANINKGDLEEAKKNFEKVIELAPESEKAALARTILENIKRSS
ncbi:MAG: tetratricopeptide repeat protein [Acidobacteriota bacterium]